MSGAATAVAPVRDRQFRGQRIEIDGKSWSIDARFGNKAWKQPRTLKVYRVEGDVTDRAGLQAALEQFCVEANLDGRVVDLLR